MYLVALIYAGHEPAVPEVLSALEERAGQPTAPETRPSGTQRNPSAQKSWSVCTDMCMLVCNKDGVIAFTWRRADLRKRARLDTRTLYLDRDCFRMSWPCFVDYRRVELRNPGVSGFRKASVPYTIAHGCRADTHSKTPGETRRCSALDGARGHAFDDLPLEDCGSGGQVAKWMIVLMCPGLVVNADRHSCNGT